MPTLNITIPGKLKAAIDQRIASGEYAGLDDYLSDLVRRDEQRRERREMEHKLLDRLDRSGAVEMDAADFSQIRRRLLSKIKSGKKA